MTGDNGTPGPADDAAGTDAWIARLDEKLEMLTEHPDPAVREAVEEVVDGVRRLHAEGMGRLVDLLRDDPDRFRRALADPLVANLLVLHDLVVIDEWSRAREAVEAIADRARRRGGRLELSGVEEGRVRVRITGHGVAWRDSVEEVVRALDRILRESMPGYAGLELDGPAVRRQGGGYVVAGDADGGWRSFVPLENIERLEARLRDASGDAT